MGNLESELQARGVQAVVNDNDQFHEWLLENVDLKDAIQRCPNILTELFEEYNNDWIEAVEAEASSIGMDSDLPDDEFDEDDEDGLDDEWLDV
jgi:hypothetical protein